jgi:PIN domain nuclease of toxin-antitoxin system
VILLDTHVLIWLAEGRAELGAEARRRADAALAGGKLAVSAITFWEVAMLHAHGRIHLRVPVETWRSRLLQLGLGELPVTGEEAIAATKLESFHAEPADRLIVASACLHRAALLTADQRILGWPGSMARHDARL